LVDEIFQMMDVANALSMFRRVNPACRTAIVTLSGGAGILACDAIEKRGLTVAQLSEETRKEIGEVFPAWMPVSNPVDLFPAVSSHGREVAFRRAISAVLNDSNVDVLLIHFVAGLDEGVPDLAELKRRADENGKLVLFWLMGLQQGCERFRQEARALGILVHEDVSRIADCLWAASKFWASRWKTVEGDRRKQDGQEGQ
jgi:acyl-CoA synthetase (NDP forming)